MFIHVSVMKCAGKILTSQCNEVCKYKKILTSQCNEVCKYKKILISQCNEVCKYKENTYRPV